MVLSGTSGQVLETDLGLGKYAPLVTALRDTLRGSAHGATSRIPCGETSPSPRNQGTSGTQGRFGALDTPATILVLSDTLRASGPSP